MSSSDEIINQFNSYTQHWFNSYLLWMYAGELLGVLIIIGSITIASAPSFITRLIDVKTVAFLTGVLTGVNTFIDPMPRMWRANH